MSGNLVVFSKHLWEVFREFHWKSQPELRLSSLLGWASLRAQLAPWRRSGAPQSGAAWRSGELRHGGACAQEPGGLGSATSLGAGWSGEVGKSELTDWLKIEDHPNNNFFWLPNLKMLWFLLSFVFEGKMRDWWETDGTIQEGIPSRVSRSIHALEIHTFPVCKWSEHGKEICSYVRLLEGN